MWSALPRKGASATYFAALGLGFMFFEITLIQRLMLFLGYPTYSLTVTLASILVFTGVGALLSRALRSPPACDRRPPVRWPSRRSSRCTCSACRRSPRPCSSWPLAARVFVAFVVLAPLGVCLGMFMPLGLGTVAGLSAHPREYVAWAWAVNGFASVIGAVLTTILAMTFGFNVVLVLALAVYGVALAVLRSLAAVKPVASAAVEQPPAVVGVGAP